MPSIDPSLTTRAALEQWLLEFHESTAILDAKHCTQKFFTRDVEVQYANNPTAQGIEQAQGFFDSAFKALDSMTHEIVYFDFVAPNRLYQAAKIRYVVKGDDPVKDVIAVPAMMTTWLVEEKGRLMIKRNEIFLDASAVFGRMHEKGLI